MPVNFWKEIVSWMKLWNDFRSKEKKCLAKYTMNKENVRKNKAG